MCILRSCMLWLLVSLVITLTGVDGWMTQYQESFNFSCPAHQYICSTNSAYDDSYDDRVYDFTCCELTGDLPVQGCKWTDYVSYLDTNAFYRCVKPDVIVSIDSYYDSDYQDRLLRFNCCQVPTLQIWK
ncbi:dermatopontin-like [Pomacea canaliculata]|uniref:dermatopontin-like n=1 Tax=Pomacea canaliculata TaxID=400727 RepID=UPI000D73D980|nr:dermatopontin-like [Pomacea canaliculata]